jgi:SNF2 family DNA or RNA helicase
MPIVTNTGVDVSGKRILVRTGFSNLLVCKGIAGASWDTEHRAWSYPATPQVARLISDAFRNATVSDAFRALANWRPQDARAAAPPPQVPDAQPAPTRPPVPPTIPNLKTTPWKHQVLAYQFMYPILGPAGGAGMLAMDMGTGKSLTTIGEMCNLSFGPTHADLILLVCPLRVVDVWPNQIRQHAGVPISVLALGEDAGAVARKTERAIEAVALAKVRQQHLAIVINYESLWRDPFAKWALSQKWGLVVCDESHRIKSPGGKQSMFCARLSAHSKYRLALTGTPMPHSPLDVYGQYRFLDNRIFGKSYHAFKQRYAVLGGFQAKQVVAYKNLEELQSLMRPITFRVGKDVLDLPPETHVTYHCNLSPEGARVYRSLDQDFVADVKSGLVTAANAMVKLLRLQQVTGGTVKTEDDRLEKVDQSKQNLLADTFEDIGKDEPIVVFCRFHSDLDAVHAAAASHGMSSMELSGRRDDLKRWQAGEAQVLAVQISAGGVGVDLTRARYNIYYSLSFSLGEYDQSLSRVHRPGQTRPVTHIHLIVRGSVDEKILRALEARAEVVGSILQQIKEQA